VAFRYLDCRRYDEAAQLLAEAHRNAPAGIDARTSDLVQAQMWQEINLGRLDDTRPLAQAGLAAENQPLVTGALRLAALGAERNPGVGSFAALDQQIRGFVDGDPDTLGEAVTSLRAGPRPLPPASAPADLGHVLLATGTTEDALTQARQIYKSAGAALPTAAIDRTSADAGLRTTPSRRMPRPGSGWAALTATERRVAELVGAGNTNREAATTLRISPNTVNTHLRAMFAKLDVRSRVQLANALHDHHPSTEVDRPSPTPRLVGP
jgi:DNA-binding CsgD family transcriptional regulator